MKPESKAFLAKADMSLAAAELLFNQGYLDFAASRAYYGMFYAAEAPLLEHGLLFSSHKAVVSAFGKEFAKSGEMENTLHSALIQAQRLRHAGDHEAGPQIDQAHAEQALEDARRFIAAAREKLS